MYRILFLQVEIQRCQYIFLGEGTIGTSPQRSQTRYTR